MGLSREYRTPRLRPEVNDPIEFYTAHRTVDRGSVAEIDLMNCQAGREPSL